MGWQACVGGVRRNGANELFSQEIHTAAFLPRIKTIRLFFYSIVEVNIQNYNPLCVNWCCWLPDDLFQGALFPSNMSAVANTFSFPAINARSIMLCVHFLIAPQRCEHTG